jgi:AcrR family transcriptional regulator
MMTNKTPTAPRKTPRQERSRFMVTSILDATARVLVEFGFSKTSTNLVAERAGISIGSLYQYFPSREALVAGVGRRYAEEKRAKLEALLLKSSGDDLRMDITMIVNAIAQTKAADPELSYALVREVPKLGELDWREEVEARSLALAQSLLLKHASEIRKDINHQAAGFIIAKALEGVMTALTQARMTKSKSNSVKSEFIEMVVRFLSA